MFFLFVFCGGGRKSGFFFEFVLMFFFSLFFDFFVMFFMHLLYGPTSR